MDGSPQGETQMTSAPEIRHLLGLLSDFAREKGFEATEAGLREVIAAMETAEHPAPGPEPAPPGTPPRNHLH